MQRLFDDMPPEGAPKPESKNILRKKEEATSLERLKDLEAKIAGAISKVKALKEENTALESRVRELESRLADKEDELRLLSSEKSNIREQISDLLNELETIETT
jgi:chromosome segregation ATPase